MIRKKIADAVAHSFDVLGYSVPEALLEHPADLAHGDYASNAALIAGKTTGKNPRELAEDIVKNLPALSEIRGVEIAGPGFINFFLSPDFFTNSLREIMAAKETWGKNETLSGKKVLVEYTSPNLFKPLHVGNLMSNIIGESIARLIQFSGAEVKRFNYPSDIGLTVAKAVWGIRKTKADPEDIQALGIAYREGNAAYEEDAQAKIEIDEINKKLYEKSDDELNTIYQKGRATSLRHLLSLCRLLGTEHFDFEFFESQSGPEGLSVVLQHIDDGIFERSQGAIIFNGETFGLHTEVFINSHGLPTYGAKDIGVIKHKRDVYPFDLSIIETGSEQNHYFDVVFKASEAIYPDLVGKQKHVGHGFLTLTTGKMSSRKGNVLTGETIIESLREVALSKMKERDLGDTPAVVADEIAVSAIKYQVLKQSAGKNVLFDQEQALSFEGDSGPYLQYTNARIRSVIEKGLADGIVPSTETATAHATEVEKLVYRFPEIVERAAREYEPHYVANYLIELAGAFNHWYGQEKILDGTNKASYKLALAEAVSITLQNGLWVLGIKAPERM